MNEVTFRAAASQRQIVTRRRGNWNPPFARRGVPLPCAKSRERTSAAATGLSLAQQEWRRIITGRKIAVALALLLSATSATLAQTGKYSPTRNYIHIAS